MQPETVIDLLVEHVEDHDDVALVLVYGSYARGTATDASDLDILFVSESEDADRLAVSFVVDDRTVDFWPVRWAFLDGIAGARGARPWARAASIVLDGRVAHARTPEDAHRFESIRSRVVDFINSEGRESALAAAEGAYTSVVRAVGEMHIAGTRGDDAALRIHAWDAIRASSDCVAVLGRTLLRGHGSADIDAIDDLGLIPTAVIDRLRGLAGLPDASELVSIADAYAAAVADLLSSARKEFPQAPEPTVIDEAYAEFHEHLMKVVAATEAGDGARARSVAHGVAREVAAMLYASTEGRRLDPTERMDAVLTDGGMPGAGDLLLAHDLDSLGAAARELDARLRAWMTARDLDVHVLAGAKELEHLLRARRSALGSPD